MDTAAKALLLLLNSRPLSKDTDPKGLLVAFEIAVKGIDQSAVIETCRRYIRGEVDGDTLRYAPSTAEFAKEARRQEFAMKNPPTKAEKEASEDIPQLTEEQMAARRAQVRKLLGSASNVA